MKKRRTAWRKIINEREIDGMEFGIVGVVEKLGTRRCEAQWVDSNTAVEREHRLSRLAYDRVCE